MLEAARVHRPERSTSVPVALMVSTAHGDAAVDANVFQAWVDAVTSKTSALLEQCGVSLDVRRAELVAVPSNDLVVTATAPDSTGFAPVDGGREALMPQVDRLFRFARRALPADTLAVVAVDEIRYAVEQRPSVAGGLSFPPLAFDTDQPGVLIGVAYGRCGSVPELPHERVVAHELLHMLLNQPEHEGAVANLLSKQLGPSLTAAQCERLRDRAPHRR